MLLLTTTEATALVPPGSLHRCLRALSGLDFRCPRKKKTVWATRNRQSIQVHTVINFVELSRSAISWKTSQIMFYSRLVLYIFWIAPWNPCGNSMIICFFKKWLAVWFILSCLHRPLFQILLFLKSGTLWISPYLLSFLGTSLSFMMTLIQHYILLSVNLFPVMSS